MKKKKIIITVDTEEDNQWDTTNEQTTNNAYYLQRFQDLCNLFDFKPVYLVTYNMANNPIFEKMVKHELDLERCEIGMHLHAWSTPPTHEIDYSENERPYLIEYPNDVMERKFYALDNLLRRKYGNIVSHRSGRWAMNDYYYELLKKYGYKCDCSVTPGLNWEKCLGATGIGGNDYSKNNEDPTIINGIFEVPVTIKKIRCFDFNNINGIKTFAKELYYCLFGRITWFRPSIASKKQMCYLADKVFESDSDYLMFMIHSSELMPGGSPYYMDSISIDNLYSDLREVFEYVYEKYEGVTLKEYVKEKGSVSHDKKNL